jgi:uracil-DNA glycosylase
MNVSKQILDRLQSLATAGVEWLPKSEPLVITPQAPPELASQPLAVPLSVLETRTIALQQLDREVSSCQLCAELFSTRTQTVFGIGQLSPDLCLIGEAPGADEDKQGEPFVGKAGQLLTKILKAAGFERSDVYIMNTLKCRPPMNAKPTAVQLQNCKPFFLRQLELIQPKMICCLGGVAIQHLLGITDGITKIRGQFYDYEGIPVMPTYHPSYLIRAEGTTNERQLKGECWSDFQAMVKRLGRDIPKSAS